MKQKKVGILMPYYNAEEFIVEAIDSLLEQTYENFSIYTIDDGSTDQSSIEIALNVVLPSENWISRMHHSHSAINLGWGHQFNYLASQAIEDNCDYLFLMNADDLLEPNALERMANELEEKSVDWVNIDAEIFGSQKGAHINTENATADQFKNKNQLTSFALIKASVWREMGGYDLYTKNGYHDRELWIRLLKNGYKYSVIRELLYRYRMHGDNFHKKVDRSKLDYILKKHYK